MKKRTLKKARIQLQICIPLLCIGILAAGVLIVKNLSWAEISMAAVGIFLKRKVLHRSAGDYEPVKVHVLYLVEGLVEVQQVLM